MHPAPRASVLPRCRQASVKLDGLEIHHADLNAQGTVQRQRKRPRVNTGGFHAYASRGPFRRHRLDKLAIAASRVIKLPDGEILIPEAGLTNQILRVNVNTDMISLDIT